MDTITKKLLLIFLIGTAVFVIGTAIYGDFNFESVNEFLINFGFFQLYALVLGGLNMAYFNYLDKRVWEEKNTVKRIVVGVVGSVVLTLIGLFLLRMCIEVYYGGVTFNEFIAEESIGNYTFGLWITLTIVVVFHVVYFFKKSQEKKVTESQIVAKTESAKYESLKSQLDPHFLFNSLNVLTSLIGESPVKAENFTTKLSKIYRYVLEQKNKDIIPLKEELQFAKTYMELLAMRFEDAISYTLPEKISNSELKIVPLSLQLLLENAVKHNVVSSKKPLQIEIYEEGGYLVVSNNYNPKESLGKSTKVGLKNISDRYRLITKKEVSVQKENGNFIVKIPLLTKNITIMKTDYINDSNKYIRAKKRIDDLKGFYGGLVSYCVVIPFLIFINYKTSWGYQWFWFPMFGWGLGVIIHAFTIFGYGGDWENRKIREYMSKDDF
ncbi:MAG: 2TM domain-containing protein [Polaribacter sp.]|nr:2TM domain-containing protein [Polaribacter sp.]